VAIRLCSPARLAAGLTVDLGAALAAGPILRSILELYKNVLGAPPPAPLEALTAAVILALLGFTAGLLARSPILGAATALAGAQWLPPHTGLEAGAASALLAAGASGALGLLGGYPGDSALRRNPRGRLEAAGPILAVAATVILAVSRQPWPAPCNPLWPLGSVAAAAAAASLEPLWGLSLALTAALGWHSAALALLVRSLWPAEAPRCGGVEAWVSGVYGWHPSHLHLGRPRPGWWGWGFACASGRATIVPLGPRGGVVVAWGPTARAVGASLLRGMEGLVLCAGCRVDYWVSQGLASRIERYTPGGPPPNAGRGSVVVVEGERPWDHLLTAAGALASSAAERLDLVVVDGAAGVDNDKILEAAADELLDVSTLVVIVFDDPSRLPPRIRVAGASALWAAAGPLPPRLLTAVYPIGWQAAEALSYMLERGHVVFYPTCGGAAVSAPAGGLIKSYQLQ
jgi:hypothetical protein